MAPDSAPSKGKHVDDELAAVLPDDSKPWYKKTHLLKLNFIICSLVLFCTSLLTLLSSRTNPNMHVASANGYDGSLMNGLQALPRWNEFMDQPAGAWLGFINAIYWRRSPIVVLRRSNKTDWRQLVTASISPYPPGSLINSVARSASTSATCSCSLGQFCKRRHQTKPLSSSHDSFLGVPQLGSEALHLFSSTRLPFQLTAALPTLCSCVDGTLAALSLLGLHSLRAITVPLGTGACHPCFRYCYPWWRYLVFSWLLNLHDGWCQLDEMKKRAKFWPTPMLEEKCTHHLSYMRLWRFRTRSEPRKMHTLRPLT